MGLFEKNNSIEKKDEKTKEIRKQKNKMKNRKHKRRKKRSYLFVTKKNEGFLKGKIG